MRIIYTIIKRIFLLNDNDIRTGEINFQALLAKGTSGTFILQLISIGLAFITSIILARILGAAGYGAYVFAMAWMGVLCVPGLLGMDKLLIRNISSYHSQLKWALARGLLQRSSQAASLITISLAVIAGSIALMLLNDNSFLLYPFLISLLMLPFTVLNQLRKSTMQALHYVVLGQIPEVIIRPVFFVGLVGGTYFLFGQRFSAQMAVTLNVLATMISFFAGLFFLQKILPDEIKKATPVYDTRSWLHSAVPLLFVAGMQVINARTDIIMLGAIKGVEVSGIYAVATRGAGLISFILVAVNTALGPIISNLYANKEMKLLQQVITKSARLILFFSVPMAACLAVFSKWFMLAFGAVFIKGQAALIVLTVGQLINAMAGSVGLILIITNHEQDATVGIGVGALINIILNALLIPSWGIIGAAVASATALAVWNAILVYYVWKRLGINSTAIGAVRLIKRRSSL